MASPAAPRRVHKGTVDHAALRSPARKAERNGRLFAVPRRSHSEQGLRDVRDLSKPIQQELEKFFVATDKLEDKKLEIIGWKGPKIAMKAIKDSAKVAVEWAPSLPIHRKRSLAEHG